MNPIVKSGLYFIMTCSLVLLIGGCSKKIKTSDTIKDMNISEEQTAFMGEVNSDPGIEEETIFEQEISEDSEAMQRNNPYTSHIMFELEDIFFDYDKDHMRPEAFRVLKKNADWLKKNPNVMIVIEGHADERGTNEYNLALGERRSRSAKRYLVSLGITPDRIRILSYGEERPFCLDHMEECWQQNRRGRFVSAD